MTHKEQLIAMLEAAGVEWREYKPDAADLEEAPQWSSSVVLPFNFGEGGDEAPIFSPFDFDKDGNLFCASAFIDPAASYCPECGAFHAAEPEKPIEYKN